MSDAATRMPRPAGSGHTHREHSGRDLRAGQSGQDVLPSANVRVVVRVRPLIDLEKRNGSESCIQVQGGQTLQMTAPSHRSGLQDRQYIFDQVLGPDTSQAEAFESSCIGHLLNSALDGYASTVFAYGQTGSGKTYTMSGLEERILETGEFTCPDTDGLLPRCLTHLFAEFAQRPSKTYTVRASYLEIYNEQCLDLLNFDKHGKTQPLHLRHNPESGFFVENLLVVECADSNDLAAVAAEGHKNRHVGSHHLNRDSSRSHSMMTIYIDEETRTESGQVLERHGKISFVDLAGSENLKQSKSKGEMVKETAQINKSLFTLGKVISVLGDIHTGKRPRGTHVPYRDSTVTKLLMDSLGGSGLCMMIACCSPASEHFEETVRTLNYATRARNIQNRPVQRMDPKDLLILNLQADLNQLKMENNALRQLMTSHGLQGALPPALHAPSFNESSTPQATVHAVTPHRRAQEGDDNNGRRYSGRLAALPTYQRSGTYAPSSSAWNENAGTGPSPDVPVHVPNLDFTPSGHVPGTVPADHGPDIWRNPGYDGTRAPQPSAGSHRSHDSDTGFDRLMRENQNLKVKVASLQRLVLERPATSRSSSSNDVKSGTPGQNVLGHPGSAGSDPEAPLRRSIRAMSGSDSGPVPVWEAEFNSRVEVSGTGIKRWGSRESTPRLPTGASTVERRRSQQSRGSLEDLHAYNPFKSENEKLKAQNKTMRHKNMELLRRLKDLENGHNDYRHPGTTRKEVQDLYQLRKANTALERQIEVFKERERLLVDAEGTMRMKLRDLGAGDFADQISANEALSNLHPLSRHRSRSISPSGASRPMTGSKSPSRGPSRSRSPLPGIPYLKGRLGAERHSPQRQHSAEVSSPRVSKHSDARSTMPAYSVKTPVRALPLGSRDSAEPGRVTVSPNAKALFDL